MNNNLENSNRIVDILIVLASRKMAIFLGSCISLVCGGLFSLSLPDSYRADTKILPPQQAQSGAAALLSQLGGVAGAAAGAAGVKNPNDLYIGMLKSRVIGDAIIKRYDLQKIYGKKQMDAARKQLALKSTIASGKDGLISIDVEDSDPARAAQIANSYADELLALTKVVAITEAGQRRLFFEKQLQTSKTNLENSESALKAALGKTGVINVDSESRAMVEMVGRLRAQIGAKEIQLRSLQPFITTSNQEYRRLQTEIASARVELSKLENGSPSDTVEVTKDNGLQNMKTLRDVKYHQMLYELLAKQYEVARLDESKDASIIQVLDKAIPPENKSGPKRTIITITSGIFGFLMMIGWAVTINLKDRALLTTSGRAQYDALRAALWKRKRA